MSKEELLKLTGKMQEKNQRLDKIVKLNPPGLHMVYL